MYNWKIRIKHGWKSDSAAQKAVVPRRLLSDTCMICVKTINVLSNLFTVSHSKSTVLFSYPK